MVGVPKKKCYFALKEEVLLTVITGVRKKKDSAFVQTTHLSLNISVDLALYNPQKVGGSHIHSSTLSHSHSALFLQKFHLSLSRNSTKENFVFCGIILCHMIPSSAGLGLSFSLATFEKC